MPCSSAGLFCIKGILKSYELSCVATIKLPLRRTLVRFVMLLNILKTLIWVD